MQADDNLKIATDRAEAAAKAKAMADDHLTALKLKEKTCLVSATATLRSHCTVDLLMY